MMSTKNSFENLLIAEDPLSKLMLATARKAAKSIATILITGQTGVGKELIARYIHQHSDFSTGPYISVNCAALPENMVESILFGYEKGAFTGAATMYVGKFEQAQNGTLLLDEIAELPLGLQAKLLRVLQERQIERLGGKRLININVRIVCATNRDLQQQVIAGMFRSDLYYRLNVIPVLCEGLHARPLDILPLANYFINKYGVALNSDAITLTHSAEDKLLNYTWPGNVRELENVIHRAIIMAKSNVIDADDLEIKENVNNNDLSDSLFLTKLKATEAQVILDVLRQNEGSRYLAAKKLNMSPRTLRYKISKLKLIGVQIPK
jgi:two-component system response regulator FlrC